MAKGRPTGERTADRPLPADEVDGQAEEANGQVEAQGPARVGDSGADGAGERTVGEPPEEAEVADAEEPTEAEEGDPLARAIRERDEYLALAQRTQADFENYRRRAARDAAAAGARAKGGLVRELLPVVDNLERALASAEEEDSGLAEGVRLVLTELLAVLERNGVTGFEPEGEQFDPTVHEAVSTHQQDGADPGTVIHVVEKGYSLDDSVIRPARVVVAA